MKKDIHFQILDCDVFNEEIEEEDSDFPSSSDEDGDSEFVKKKVVCNKKFIVQLFGRNEKGESVSVSVTDFTPFFFVKIPDYWEKSHVEKFGDFIRGELLPKYRSNLISVKKMKKFEFYGFTNFEKYSFVRFVFTNVVAMRKCIKIFQRNYYYTGDTVKLAYVESAGDYGESGMTPQENRRKIKRERLMTKKKKLDMILQSNLSRRKLDDVKIDDLIGIIKYFNQDKNNCSVEWFYNSIKIAKTDFLSCDLIQNEDFSSQKIDPYRIKIPGLTNKPILFKLYDTKLEPMLRFMHLRDISPSGWVILPGGKWKKGCLKDTSLEKTRCKRNYTIKWNNILSKKTTDITPIIIASYDIESDSSHGDFPQAVKDWKKVAEDIVVEYLRLKEQNKTSYIFKIFKRLLETAFSNDPEMEKENNISHAFTKFDIVPTESQIDLIAKKLQDAFVSDADDSKKNDKKASFFEMRKNKVIKNKKKSAKGLKKRELITFITELLNEEFGKMNIYLKGDPVIQIGTVFMRFGEDKPFLKHIITLDTCDDIEGAVVVPCETEEEVLLEWTKLITSQDPDIITGYNIFGFDYKYMKDRAHELSLECIESETHKKWGGCGCCLDKFLDLGRLKSKKSYLKEKVLASSAMGSNEMWILMMNGRISIDLLKVVLREHKLGSYKLDNVSAHFIRGKLIDNIYEPTTDTTKLITDNTDALSVEGYITIMINRGTFEEKLNKGQKWQIISLTKDCIEVRGDIELYLKKYKYNWCQAKDDVSPKDIFRLQKGTSSDRAIVAKYCIKDCVLCLDLMNKLSIIPNNIGMANVCSVPLSYIFQRGQGIKVFSLISKECYNLHYVIPELYKSTAVGSYEGAIVLKPKPGIYLDEPIAVLDYSSLYPSSMISHNLSHDSIVLDSQWEGEEGKSKLEDMGYKVEDVYYDIYDWQIIGNRKNATKVNTGKQKCCRYVQPKREEDGSIKSENRAIIPRILESLLAQRKKTRRRIKYKTILTKTGDKLVGLVEDKGSNWKVKLDNDRVVNVSKDNVVKIQKTYNDFQNQVWDGLQLAYKITANSMYGSIGAKTSNISFIDIAASTTSVGRTMLETAADFALKEYPDAEITYGDTDSIFVNFHTKDSKGNPLKGREALKKVIECGERVEKLIAPTLPKPQYLEYEKTFWPFILFTKKRYVGNKYEFDINKFKQTCMGIVLKRRDNAPIVKLIYGGIIDILMATGDIDESINFLQRSMMNLINGEFSMELLIISKSLKPTAAYADPTRIAHWVLANRMGERDPGNKPAPNDRIPYVYIEVDERKITLQGDRIEHPDYVKEHGLKIDYGFYITNQIMKPVCQIYDLLDDIDSEELFDDVRRIIENRKSGNSTITSWFSRIVQ